MDPFDNMTNFEYCPYVEPIGCYRDISEERSKKDIKKDKYYQVDKIYKNIRKNNPMIIRRLMMCQIPYPQVERIIKRIITLTLYYKEE